MSTQNIYISPSTGGAGTLQDVLTAGNEAVTGIILKNGADETVAISPNGGVGNLAYVQTNASDGLSGIGIFASDGEDTYIQFYNNNFDGYIHLKAEDTLTTNYEIVLPGANGTVLLDNLLGVINGIATLDAGGTVPAAQLPYTLLDYKGSWNASTNTPTLAAGVGDVGDLYFVSVSGTQDLGEGSILYSPGNIVIYNGTIWNKINSAVTGTITSVTSTSADLTVNLGTTTPELTVVSAPKITTARNINNVAFDGTGDILLNNSYNNQSGTTYTFVLADNQKIVTANNSSPQTYTVPANASVAFPTGTRIDLVQIGTGAVTIAVPSPNTDSVAINSFGGLLTIGGRYGAVSLLKTGTNTWILLGNLI